MPKIDLLGVRGDVDKLADLFINSLPKGQLYSDSLKPFVKGFLEVYADFYKNLNIAINDQFELTKDSFYLDEFRIQYGLPNALFPVINNNEELVFAISVVKQSQLLVSKEDFENFLKLFGFNVSFFKQNTELSQQFGFPYSFPITFSPGFGKKDKFKYLVYVEETSTPSDFRNIGDAFPIEFYESQDNLSSVRKILDYIKPDYLIFQYIDLETKNLYGL